MCSEVLQTLLSVALVELQETEEVGRQETAAREQKERKDLIDFAPPPPRRQSAPLGNARPPVAAPSPPLMPPAGAPSSRMQAKPASMPMRVINALVDSEEITRLGLTSAEVEDFKRLCHYFRGLREELFQNARETVCDVEGAERTILVSKEEHERVSTLSRCAPPPPPSIRAVCMRTTGRKADMP